MNNTDGSTFDSLKSLPSFAPSFGSVSRTSMPTVGGSRNASMNRSSNVLPGSNNVTSRRAGTDFDHRRTSLETPDIDKCFGFDDDDDDMADNGAIELPTKAPAAANQSSALSKVRADLKRFLHGSTKKQPETAANTGNQRSGPTLFKSPTKEKPVNGIGVFDKNRQRDIRSAFVAKSSDDRNIEPSSSGSNRIALFEEGEEGVIVSVNTNLPHRKVNKY